VFLRARYNVGVQHVFYVCSWVSLHASEAPLDGDQRWSKRYERGVIYVSVCVSCRWSIQIVCYICACVDWQSSPRAKT
jgi:hypothetical protein